MSVTITLHVFSGRPDPAWELSDKDAKELADRIAGIDQTTLLKPAGIGGGLGYRGFSIEAVREEGLDPHIYLHGGIVDLERFDLNRVVGNSELEKWLLSTAGDIVDPDLSKYVEGEFAGNAKAIAPSSAPARMLAGPPPYNPGKWNNDPNIRRRNNCYNYVNDKITNTFAQPGLGSGQMYSALTCGDVGAASQRDGQVPVSSASSTPAQGHFIALVVWPPYQDYHFYRLDNNAMWSHKPGGTPAKNVDNSGDPISDPRNCNRGPYTDWCSFYHCIPANTRIL